MAMNVQGIDHLEFYVGSIADAVSQLCVSFGFGVHGQGGPKTGLQGCQSVLLRQNEISIVCTSALTASHPAAGYVHRHGEGVSAIGLLVDDAKEAYEEAVRGGATPAEPPVTMERDGSRTVFASVIAFGDVVHRFVSRRAPGDLFAPGVIDQSIPAPASGGLLERIDHVAVCLPAGELDRSVRQYQTALGFQDIFEEHILVGSQAMNSKVVQSPSGNVTLTLLEPDTRRDPGQIDEFVNSHGGAGVQHIAFLTHDITTAVRTISDRGVRFLQTPKSYYDALPSRLGPAGAPLDTLRDLNILADRDNWGLMLQIFTETQHPLRTFFYELIDRRGARTFGSRNIQALYEAVERQRLADQALQA
jgi:4-hydroxymandelate synthase